MNVSIQMKEDQETDKAFGWVLEMYAYAVASALHGVQHILRKDFMIQVLYLFMFFCQCLTTDLPDFRVVVLSFMMRVLLMVQ
jgi:NADPH-dependent 7-cyano-7-deazaguanine reductase QueF